MSPRDAFGREIGEDPLDGMGWDSDAAPPPTAAAAPASTAGPVAMPPAASEYSVSSPTGTAPSPSNPYLAPPAPPAKHRSVGGVAALVVVLLVLGGIAGGIVLLGSLAADEVDEARDRLNGLPAKILGDAEREAGAAGADTDATAEDAPPPRGLQRGSLLRPAELRRAVRRLRTYGSRAVVLRISADRITAQMPSRTGAMTVATITHTGSRTVVRAGQVPSTTPTLRLADLDTAVPARLVRRTAKAHGRRTTAFDYAVAMQMPGLGLRWSAYVQDGKGVTADARGRVEQELG